MDTAANAATGGIGSWISRRAFLSADGALNDDAQVTEAELIGYARERLAHFKCPTRVEFVAELPRNATGKVLKTTLRRDHGGHDATVPR